MCAICTGRFNNHSQISACPCGHIFHSHCLNARIRSSHPNHLTCPQCRAVINDPKAVIARLFLNKDDDRNSPEEEETTRLKLKARQTDKLNQQVALVSDFSFIITIRNIILTFLTYNFQKKSSRIKWMDLIRKDAACWRRSRTQKPRCFFIIIMSDFMIWLSFSKNSKCIKIKKKLNFFFVKS
jgi:hypothetical protein